MRAPNSPQNHNVRTQLPSNPNARTQLPSNHNARTQLRSMAAIWASLLLEGTSLAPPHQHRGASISTPPHQHRGGASISTPPHQHRGGASISTPPLSLPEHLLALVVSEVQGGKNGLRSTCRSLRLAVNDCTSALAWTPPRGLDGGPVLHA